MKRKCVTGETGRLCNLPRDVERHTLNFLTFVERMAYYLTNKEKSSYLLKHTVEYVEEELNLGCQLSRVITMTKPVKLLPYLISLPV